MNDSLNKQFSVRNIILKLDEIGRSNQNNNVPQIRGVKIFKNIINKDGSINKKNYHLKDDFGVEFGELLTRYLFLNAILDQGPDMDGVRLLQSRVTNILYDNKIYFLHEPYLFFKNLNSIFKIIDEEHNKLKKELGPAWQKRQNTKKQYSLFLENSSQLSSYVLGRWGPPISIIQILANNQENLLDLFKRRKSAEDLAEFIKSDKNYGMGKAIGDKAAHLLVKWLIYSYELIDLKDTHWGQNSYEVPFDSNAGRVLFMSGFFHYFFPSLNNLSDIEKEKKWLSSGRIQKFTKEKDKQERWTGKYHMYITNSFRGQTIESFGEDSFKDIKPFLKETLNKNPQKKIEVQHMINYLSKNLGTKIGAIDDGLMYVGTKFCINRGNQLCDKCPLRDECSGKEDFKRKNNFFT